MKTLTKTLALSLVLASSLFIAQQAQAKCLTPNCIESVKEEVKVSEEILNGENEEFNYNFSEPLVLEEKASFLFYNHQDQLVFSGEFSEEEAGANQELQSYLKQGEFLLSGGNAHYFAIEE